MRIVLALAALVAVSGCTHSIVAPCLSKQQYEELKGQEPEKVRGKLTGKADEDIRPITGSNLMLRQWGHNLLDALRVCAE